MNTKSIDSHTSASRATALGDGSCRQCPTCRELIAIGSPVAFNDYRQELHEACAGRDAPKASAARTPTATTAEPKTLFDRVVDIYCEGSGSEVGDEQPVDEHGKTLLDRACDAWLGT